jgi:YihY family inner membrane protein
MVESAAERLQAHIGKAIDSLYRALGRNRITRFPWAVIQTFSDGHGALLAGSMAYYTFLSLLPLLMIAGFVLGTISQGDPGAQDALIRGVERLFPGIGGRDLLDQLIRSRVAFGVFGLVTVSYAGSGFVGASTAALNRMWAVPKGRNPVGQKIVNLFAVVLLAIVLMGSVAVTLWVGSFTEATLGRGARPALGLLDWVASPLSVFLVLLLLYWLLPARPLTPFSQVPGALIGAVVIDGLKRAFAVWARHSAGVAVLPRSVLSIVLLLVWLGFLCQAILYGAALNVVIDRRKRGAPLLPTATG